MPATDWPLGNCTALRRALVRWYERHQRDLPWRQKPVDPYRILVSEAMLQQTQVATVIAYFQRFMKRFPNIRSLAEANEQEVLSVWQGLGYYRRACHLHAAAKLVQDRHGGRIPDTRNELLELPGVGRYSAGAIASIAFDRREPILDGNVARVLARVLAIACPIDDAKVQRHLWDAADRLVPRASPGRFNQALMELGATVCTPRSPTCPRCPITRWCEAARAGSADRLPRRRPRRAPRRVTHHVVAVTRQGRFVFERRPSAGLWSSMWQMPTAEQLAGQVTARTLQDWAMEHLDFPISPPNRRHRFEHQTTHRTITFVLWLAHPARPGCRLSLQHRQWRPLHDVADLPLANPQRRVITLLGEKS